MGVSASSILSSALRVRVNAACAVAFLLFRWAWSAEVARSVGGALSAEVARSGGGAWSVEVVVSRTLLLAIVEDEFRIWNIEELWKNLEECLLG